MRKLVLAVTAYAGLVAAVRADVITGAVSNWMESGPVVQIGDGTNHVRMWWSINQYGLRGWFYGSAYDPQNTDVALANEITQVTQITDASIFDFTDFYVGPAAHARADPDGVGDFLIWRHISTGHYGVLRIDDIDFDELNGTWWFQTDGGGDFSGQGEPCDGYSPCDANCDGSVNGFDIQNFVDTLSGRPGCSPCAADTNGDGSVNGFDIQGFVECLGG